MGVDHVVGAMPLLIPTATSMEDVKVPYQQNTFQLEKKLSKQN